MLGICVSLSFPLDTQKQGSYFNLFTPCLQKQRVSSDHFGSTWIRNIWGWLQGPVLSSQSKGPVIDPRRCTTSLIWNIPNPVTLFVPNIISRAKEKHKTRKWKYDSSREQFPVVKGYHMSVLEQLDKCRTTGGDVKRHRNQNRYRATSQIKSHCLISGHWRSVTEMLEWER